MRTLLCLLLSLCCSVALWADDSDYYVESWDYKAVVHADNVWDIEEQIVVDFVQPHHGIFLYKPLLMGDDHVLDGEQRRYLYRMEVEDVEVSGYDFVTTVNDDSQQNYILQIGDEWRTLTGLNRYTIRYRLVYPDDRVEAADYLFHSLLGDGWPSNIRHFSYQIRLDQPLPAEAQASCHFYSGPWESEGDALHVAERSRVEAYSISGTLNDIPGNQAITIRMELPAGYFNGVAAQSPWVPVACYLLALLILLALLYHLFTTHIERPVQTIEFYPPEGVTGAEVGTIIDESADVIDLVSLIPWFAQHGYIEITEEKGKHLWNKDTLILRRKHPLPANAPEYQQHFLKALFPKGTVQRLDELGDRHVEIERAMKSLKKLFVGDRELSTTSSWLVLLPVAQLLLLCGYFTDSQVFSFDEEKLYIGIGFGVMQLVLGFWRLAVSERRAFSRTTGWLSTLVVVLLGVLHCMYLYYDNQPQNYFLSSGFVALCFALQYVVLLRSDRFCTDTPYRLAITGKLLGLKEFIATAEKERLEKLVDENPAYFYDVLPYAMVFGLADRWSRKFQDINIDTPVWYHGNVLTDTNYLGSHIARSLTSSLSSSVTSAVTASSHDPSTSHSTSSSGGGFSGGGGGGGGGGAW